MAGAVFARCFLLSQRSSSSSFYILRQFCFSASPPSSLRAENQFNMLRRAFSSSSSSSSNRNSKLVNFSPSDSDSDSDSDSEDNKSPTTRRSNKEIDNNTKLPPPYDPFNKKKPAFVEPDDPKNLPEVFHKMSSDGLFNNAVKMFDALSKDGLTHEALELFSQIKDKGHMPDVVSHTAVLEAYANAGQAKEANRTYLRMLASGVSPNAYTYSVLIKSLAGSGETKLIKEAKKYVKEMIEKGMKPNAGTCVAMFETFLEEEKVEEGREFLEEIKAQGFEPDEKAVREVLRGKRGPVPKKVIEILFAR
ncbi:pentatricopeptide repeat-containing protein At4g38150-like [Impatiens glandulifera]|uniref:pentatricopeptide repeat-containing protein At4g38150-like n=1 Tax=Impatiens glandulifera TaxID=253017 RepID=UPI001FB15233|nr:pentatricopeptide repeat-containing protein At4g38150-like [Impatiens glandulifera]XP_047327436.1 pentatricopeptide repeat-containing protein At4g38150-like [Impatiens glandulifera]XP_047327437.1 pentatricopeptide repeat-containing protein At4g38150-like [Impatiens glandulifera]